MAASDTFSRLLQSKDEKIANLSEKTFADESLSRDTYTDTGDGYVENNGNKIWDISEEWTPEEMSFAKDYLQTNYALPDASTADRRAYEYGVTAEGKYIDPNQEFQPDNYDPVKVGLASGKYDTSDRRYLPEDGYGWTAGTHGVDVTDNRSDQNLDYTAATAFEALVHSQKSNLSNRLVKQRADGWYDYASPTGMRVIDKEEKNALFESGASEYYINHDSIFNDAYDPTKVDQEKVIQGLQEAMGVVRDTSPYAARLYANAGGDTSNDLDREAIYQRIQTRAADSANLGDRQQNTLSGFASTFTNELIINPLDAVGDATGWFDLGSDAEKTRNSNDFFGYNPLMVERAMEEVGKEWDIIADGSVSTADRMRAASRGVFEVFTTPEMLGTSLGALLAWVSPGKFLKLLGVGTAFDKTSKAISALEQAGTITKQAARAQKAKAFMSVNGAKSFLTSQSGMVTAAMGNVNNQYEKFVENNNGTELHGAEKTKWMATRFSIQLVNQNIEKLVDFNIIKNPGVLASIAPAVVAMTNKEFSTVAKAMAKGIAKTSENMGREAVQEYTQTMMELTNTRYGSEKFSDVDSFTAFIMDERNTRESGIAAIAGMGGSLQFEVVGTAGKGLTALVPSGSPTTITPAPTSTTEGAPKTEDEVKEAKTRYKNLLTRLGKGVAEGKINSTNMHGYLDDLEELNASKHIVSTSSPEQQVQAEKVYNTMVNGLEAFVSENAGKQLTKRITRKTIQESLSEQEILGNKPTSNEETTESDYDDYTRSIDAERIVHTLLGNNRTYGEEFSNELSSFATSNNVSVERYRDIVKSYTSVEDEATAGSRGYVARINRLKGLLESSNPKAAQIKQEYDDLVRMYASIETSSQRLSRGVKTAENKAAQMNKQKVLSSKSVKITTEYLKYNPKTKAYDEPYTIYIKKGSDGRWSALTADANKRLAQKTRYTKEINQELQSFSRRADSKIPGVVGDINIVKVPVQEGKHKAERVKDTTYLQNVESGLKEIDSPNTTVNKVILGDTSSDKWAAEGDYSKANTALINSEDYSAEDVVLLNTLGVFQGSSKFAIPDIASSDTSSAESVTGTSDVQNMSQEEYANHLENDGVPEGVSTYDALTTRPELRGLTAAQRVEVYKANATKVKTFAKMVESLWLGLKSTPVNGVTAVGASSGWTNFKVGTDTHESGTVRHKSYATITDYVDISEVSLKNFLRAMEKAGYNGQVKFPGTGARALLSFDNIVMHGATEADAALGVKVAKQVFGGRVAATQIGVDSKGTSHTNLLAKRVDSNIAAGTKSSSTKTRELTPSQRSFKAAINAGATIVLDRELMTSGTSKKAQQAKASKIALLGYLSKKGYRVLEGTGSTILVKETEANKATLDLRKEKLDAEKKATKQKAENKRTLVSLHRALDLGIDPASGEVLTPAQSRELTKEYTALTNTVAEESFGGAQDKLTSFLERESVDEVKTLAAELLSEASPSPVAYKDKALTHAVKAYITTQEAQDVEGQELLSSWKATVEGQRLSGKERESAIKGLLSKLGAIPKALITSILGTEKSFSFGKNDMYERVYMNTQSGEIIHKPLRKNLTTKELEAFMSKNIDEKGKKFVPVGVRRVVQDPSKLVNVNRTTVLNSVPTESLSFTLRKSIKAFSKSAVAVLQKVSDAELSTQTDDKGTDGKFLAGGFNIHNSLARGIIFNKDGKPNSEVMAAMYIALGEVLATDISKISRGYKSDTDIALMFGVQEHEVTTTMRKIAMENGTLLKTLASSVGKNVLKQLGLSKRTDTDTSANEFEFLVADIGSSAILLAEDQGILESRKVSSNELAAMFKEGEHRVMDTHTFFVNVKDTEVASGKFSRKVPTKNVEKFIEGYEGVIETFPEALLERKAPFFTKPNGTRLTKALTEVRNDIVGLTVPKDAKTTLELLMNTAYEFNMDRVNEFLDAVDAEGSQVKVLMGHIDLDSAEFEGMYFRDKETQESKNRDIEFTINELRTLKTQIEANEEVDPSLYFDYFYASNDRYMMDANTINPQVDKIHRFLITPKLHKLQYTVAKNSKGGLLFSAESEAAGVSDQSYTVRLAIAQALGKGVDKLDANTVIEFSDVVLSMSAAQLAEAKEALLATGKYVVQAGGKEFKLEADHITHSLQAFDFLGSVKATKKGGSFSSSLSLEFDSLTSGFANKIQQMPILASMHKHFARTGVLTRQYQDFLAGHEKYKGADVAFDPAKGHAVSDVLYEGTSIGFLDSYQNMASTTITALKTGEVQNKNLSTPAVQGKGTSGMGIFEAIKALLPGGDMLEGKQEEGIAAISNSVRQLFKDPFMIFNYSASIGRIVKNLGTNVAHDIAKEIATADLSLDKNALVKLAAEDLLKSVVVYSPKNKTKQITTVKELQEVLRNNSLQSIPVKELVVSNPDNVKRDIKVKTLENALTEVIKLTYGEVVKEVFEKEFDPFIKVQDSMNDAFKVSFRIFDSKRVAALKKLQLSKPSRVITAEDHANVLEQLWDDFPWIVGPLTGSSNKEGVVKDVIAIATTGTKSPNEIDASRKKPQAPINKTNSKDPSHRTVSPIVRYLEEALSSGSVLPFHAIDGAEMSSTLNALGMTAVAAIHDAVIAPLDQSDNIGFAYNKAMVKHNTEYVLADALAEFADRLEKSVAKEGFDKDFKKLPAHNLKGVEENTLFTQAAATVLDNLRKQIKIIKDAREEWYGKDGLLEGAWYGNLVGTPGGMYQGGVEEGSLEYKKVFEEQYQPYNVGSSSTIAKTVVDNVLAAYNNLSSKQKIGIAKIGLAEGMTDVGKSTFVEDLIEGCIGGHCKAPAIVVNLQSRSIDDKAIGALVEALRQLDNESAADLSDFDQEPSHQDIAAQQKAIDELLKCKKGS